MSFNKETTFIKQVERTAKRDAYQTAIEYIKYYGTDEALKILSEKMECHSKFLDNLPFQYNYATQSLCAKISYQVVGGIK